MPGSISWHLVSGMISLGPDGFASGHCHLCIVPCLAILALLPLTQIPQLLHMKPMSAIGGGGKAVSRYNLLPPLIKVVQGTTQASGGALSLFSDVISGPRPIKRAGSQQK